MISTPELGFAFCKIVHKCFSLSAFFFISSSSYFKILKIDSISLKMLTFSNFFFFKFLHSKYIPINVLPNKYMQCNAMRCDAMQCNKYTWSLYNKLCLINIFFSSVCVCIGFERLYASSRRSYLC